MKTENIAVGMALKLKSTNPYGYSGDELVIEVTELRYRKHYATPFVIDPTGRAFAPSDFERALSYVGAPAPEHRATGTL